MNTYSIFSVLLRDLKMGIIRKKWHRLHPNSDTIPMNEFDFNHVDIGFGSYGELNVVDFGGENSLQIGRFVSIAQNVTFILNAEHYIDRISTYPFKVKIVKSETKESFGKGNIIVGDDVWIGYGSTIMSGVEIGQGAVIAAGSVVTKKVPPYAVVGGVPAQIIKYRFDGEIINELLKIDYSKLTSDLIEENITELYEKLSDKKQLSWLPHI